MLIFQGGLAGAGRDTVDTEGGLNRGTEADRAAGGGLENSLEELKEEWLLPRAPSFPTQGPEVPCLWGHFPSAAPPTRTLRASFNHSLLLSLYKGTGVGRTDGGREGNVKGLGGPEDLALQTVPGQR